MKILLTGANGQVGDALCRVLPAIATVQATTRDGRLLGHAIPCHALDLGVAGAVADVVQAIAPDAVVNAAAYTAVDKAESDPDLAMRINADAVAELAQACAESDIPLLHYSTDYVFDGTATQPYRPDDPTAPLGVYGHSKLAGEQAIRASGAQHLILRTAWVYGLHGHNFLRTMLRLGAERDELRVVDDQIGCPTPARVIAEVTARILQQGIGDGGTQHLVCDGQTSWHGFAEAIMADAVAAGMLERAPRVLPIPTSDYPTPAQRPAWSVLDTSDLREAHGIVLPDWRSALQATLQRAA